MTDPLGIAKDYLVYCAGFHEKPCFHDECKLARAYIADRELMEQAPCDQNCASRQCGVCCGPTDPEYCGNCAAKPCDCWKSRIGRQG